VSDDSEWGLIDQCRRGRTAAFEPLVRAHQSSALALANGMLLDRDEAADAVQDSFVRAYEGLNRLAEGSAFGPWFRSIVRNLCLDRLRAKSRHRQESLTEEAAAAEWVAPVGTKRLEQRQLADDVWTALGKISPAHREVLVLKEMEGMSYAEIASTLKVAEGTVASRVFHARAALRKELIALGLHSSGRDT
jgi:RNA polymerase sigma-70 factor (ECF subfamily)